MRPFSRIGDDSRIRIPASLDRPARRRLRHLQFTEFGFGLFQPPTIGGRIKFKAKVLSQFLSRFHPLSHACQGIAEVETDLRIVGPQVQRGAELADGRFRLAFFHQSQP